MLQRYLSFLFTTPVLSAQPSTSNSPTTSISLAEASTSASSTELTQATIQPLNQAILTFFAMVRIMINLGIFNTTTGGEAISTDERVGRLPKRVHALRTYIRNNCLVADLPTLAAFINAFHTGGNSSWLASWTRTKVMKQFAELMQNLDAAVKIDDAPQILSLLEAWTHNLFADLLATTKDQSSSDADIQASNQESALQLTYLSETTPPVDLTYAHLTQCRELIHAIAIALAMNYPIRSLELINCDLDRIALQVLAHGIKFNRTLVHLGFYDSPLEAFGYVRVQYAVRQHPSLKSLHLIKVKLKNILELPLDALPVSPNLEILRVEDNGGFDSSFAIGSIEGQSNSTEQPYKLRYLSLANCGLGVRTQADVLSSVLYHPNVSIETLDLSKNGTLPICGGYNILINAFITRDVPSKLKRLNLSSLLFDTEALTIMLQATTKTAVGQVSYLNLSSCNIYDELLEALINALATTAPASTQSSGGAASSSNDHSFYGEHLSPSSSLRTLIFAGNPIGDKGALKLIDAIVDGRLPMTKLDLSNCGITNKGASMIQLALEEKRQDGILGYIGNVAIEEMLPLRTLTLEGNDISQVMLDAIKAVIEGRKLSRPNSPSQHYAMKYNSAQTWQTSDSLSPADDPDLLLSDGHSAVVQLPTPQN